MDNYFIEQSLFPEYISDNKLKAATEKKSSDGSFAKVKTSDWNIVQMQLSKASMALY